ncbi:hypothetical protein FALBO_11081 [Fusarium albosuccineum]|uniref:Uncharacterized protein n=1 Tax=Fusarium albosuccineum TaxID=1237068 RepID=A0A8H4L383_9HYPO|nr:hypothetical protein FALBO_11081 [Fusarium albosuccineum]
MPLRSVYLAKYGGSSTQRAHFALFIPNQDCDRGTMGEDYRSYRSQGTVLHVVGEPIMSGFVFEIKRNYDGQHSKELKQLVLLGHIDLANLYDPTSTTMVKENTARSVVERHAASVPPPPRGQNIRAPIDGVKTKRCQEWTMEVLTLLAEKHLIPEEAVRIAQAQRDPPTHGIFGYKK